MEKKCIQPINVLVYTEQTTLSGLQKLVRTKANELFRDAIANNLEITGPVYWVYQGMDGNPQTIFKLEIAIPVHVEATYKGNFELKELPEFTCISEIHQGSWQQMPQVYGKVIGNILQQGHSLSGTSREIYINVNYVDFEKNITEIQVGIN